MVAICSKCHQTISTSRVGVRLTLLKARIFDKIKAAGDLGISSAELHYDIYRGYGRERASNMMRVHIGQINEVLLETSWRIVADPSSGSFARWHLRRRFSAACVKPRREQS